MTVAKTLLEMAGAKPVPAPWDGSALLLIDAQCEYTSGALKLSGIDAALAEAARLVDLARRHQRPVIHVRHMGRPGGLFDPQGAGGQIAAPVAPQTGESIVEKRLPNAFAGTDLEATLKRIGVKQLIVAGFMTHMCVSSTVRAAVDLGYSCTVVANACATRDLPDGRGGVVAAADLHRAELAALADRFAVVVGGADAVPAKAG